MSINENGFFGFRRTRGDASRVDSASKGVPALLVPATDRDMHFASAADEATDWNVSNPSDPTWYVHSETTPATDYIALSHNGTTGTINSVGGTLSLNGVTTMNLQVGGSTYASLTATELNVIDDILLSVGTGGTARFSYDTTDANANAMLLQVPAGGATDVPVLAIGQSIESVDLGLYNGLVDPRIAMFGVGAVTTGVGIDFRKARGTVAAPTVCTTGDDVGTIRGYGCVANGEYVRTAEIRFDIAGTIATTRGPGTITFLTATDAAPSVLTTAMTISAAQAVTIAGVSTTQGATHTVGVAGATTGGIKLAGATSGTVELRATDAAGSIIFILPAAVGSNGDQLSTNGNAGTATLSWTAAASLREFKDIHGIISPTDALKTIIGTPIYSFHYREDARRSTGDFETEYVGVMADEAPWAMHYGGEIINPINALGYTMGAIQALNERLERLEQAA